MALDMSKLKKLKMPMKADASKKPMPSDEKDMDLMDLGDEQGDEDGSLPPEEGSPKEEASESPEEASKELEMVSDDDLIAEIKKRGLMKQLEEGESADDESAEGQEDDSKDMLPYKD